MEWNFGDSNLGADVVRWAQNQDWYKNLKAKSYAQKAQYQAIKEAKAQYKKEAKAQYKARLDAFLSKHLPRKEEVVHAWEEEFEDGWEISFEV